MITRFSNKIAQLILQSSDSVCELCVCVYSRIVCENRRRGYNSETKRSMSCK